MQATELLDTPVEEPFDRLTRLVSEMLGVPIALLSLVDADRLFFKSQVGLPDPWASRRVAALSETACAQVVQRGEPVVISNLAQDPLGARITARPGIGLAAYAGVPLFASQGEVLGALAAIDQRPRSWSPVEIGLLRKLSDVVMAEMTAAIDRKALQRARVRLQVQQAVTEHLGRYTDFETSLPILLQTVGQGLGLDVGEYWVADHDTSVLQLHTAYWASDAIGAEFVETSRGVILARGESLPGWVWKQGRAAWCADLAEVLVPRRLQLSQRPDLRGAIAFPITDGSDILGVMVFFGRGQLSSDPEKPQFLQSLGSQIGQFAVRHQSAPGTNPAGSASGSAPSHDPLVTLSADGTIVFDPAGRILDLNPAAQRLFGQSLAENRDLMLDHLIQAGCSDQDEARPPIAQRLTAISSNFHGKPLEFTGLRGDGSVFPAQVVLSARRLKAGTSFTAVVRDGTGPQSFEEDLLATNALLQLIHRTHLGFMAETPVGELFDRTLSAILVLTGCEYGFLSEVLRDPNDQPYIRTLAITDITWDDHTRAFFNRTGSLGLEFHNLDTLFGQVLVTEQTLISNDPATDTRSGGLPPGHPPLNSFLGLPLHQGEGGPIFGMIGLANRPGGFDERLATFLAPLISSVASIIEGYQNQRERDRVEAELQAAKVAAELANLSKSQFLANMSHEVRTPVAAVLGYADMLLDPALSPQETSQVIQAIRSNGGHLLRILDDILDLSKVEAGKLQLELLPASPWKLIQDVVNSLRVRASERRITLEAEVTTALPHRVLLDPTRVRQVLVNLVSNAVKFSEPGGRVAVRLRADTGPGEPPGHLLLEVCDQGIGMSPEQLDLIFQPFQQADNSTTRRFGGTGLGLSITRRLVDLMDGSITVKSTLGQGSCFLVKLPLKPAAFGAGDAISWQTPAELRSSGRSDGRPRSAEPAWDLKGRVLLAEDSLDNQRVLLYFLKRMGLEPAVARNGLEAVDLARQVDFDLILMDMQMPELDGYSATRLLRKSGFLGPIVALTAHSLSEDREKCLQAGCDEYLTKPINMNVLAQSLSRLLADRGLRGAGAPAP